MCEKYTSKLNVHGSPFFYKNKVLRTHVFWHPDYNLDILVPFFHGY